MSAGHTPGPWQWDDAGRLLHNVPASHSSTVLVVRDPIWRPTEADAHLIAAAPVLLEALELSHAALQAMLDAWLDYHDAHSLTEPVTGKAGNAFDVALDARDKSDAAISRAHGAEQGRGE